MIQPLEIAEAIRKGLRTLQKPDPLSLSEWAAQHFYLSAESSYVQGKWEAFPYQNGILDCISNDDIRELVFIKSARVGYTKMILAALGYFAAHKHRNQAIWQPVDDDANEFVKTELDPMIRDVKAVRDVFPWHDKKSKHNTLSQKMFIGSSLFIRGGKSAKNYRRISVDVAYLDELDAFDSDIDREGDPGTLAAKRVEGSTFPKLVLGSTPKIKGQSLVEQRANQAELSLKFYVPCPKCDVLQPLKWGGDDVPYGIKWTDNDPETAHYLCEYCSDTFTQSDYLEIAKKGRWQADKGIWLDKDGLFRSVDDEIINPPLSIAFHVWTAYSELTTWAHIVREFFAVKKDRSKLKAFINTTLGESWEESEADRLDSEVLYVRREHYQAQVPEGVLFLSAGIDTQDDRFEIQVDGWGVGEERWGIDYIRLYGDPSRPGIWAKLATTLRQKYRNNDGTLFNIGVACQDHGGHYSDEVNLFGKQMGIRFLIPVKGSSVYGRPVATFPRTKNAKGVYLTEVGTDTAKELLLQRLGILEPGPGYWHWPIGEIFNQEYFKQLTAEERIPKWVKGGWRYVWDSKSRRNEAWDCSVYSLAAIRIAQQHMGLKLDHLVQKAPRGRRIRSKGIS